MPHYKVVLKGGFELDVEANNYAELYAKLQEINLDESVNELWVRLSTRVKED